MSYIFTAEEQQQIRDAFVERIIDPSWGIAETFKGDNYGERT
jgi:hypothetical protein